MSHYHDNKEIRVTASSNDDTAIPRQHSYTHLNLKPTNVFDHIKSKVRRKCNSTKGLSETPTITIDNNDDVNINDRTRRTSDENNQLTVPSNGSLTKAHSQPMIATQTLSDQESNASHENTHNDGNNSSPEKNENKITTSDQIDKKDNDITTLKCDIVPLPSDTENNKKKSKSKTKSIKESKTLAELVIQADTKKQRGNTRRTEQSSSKKQHSKKNKKNALNNMETNSGLNDFNIRDDEFNKLFEDLPADEQLLVAYPCIWRKDIFMHGRIFLSVNYVCFYTCFFQWEENACIAWKDIVSVTREKSVKVLLNAIRLQLNNGEQYIFASLTPRKQTFVKIFRLWQNALQEKPLNYPQLRAVISADQFSGDESSEDSEESLGLGNKNERFSDHYDPQPQSVSTVPSNPSVHSSTVSPASNEQEHPTYVSTCSCENHLARAVIDRTFPYHVDQLYELIFSDNAFSRAYHDSQKLTDFNLGEWHMNSDSGKRERGVTYKTISQSILGTNTIICTEKQIIEAEISHVMYVISTEVYNEGVKYTDAFFVATRYCMFQRDAKHCVLRITAEIKYIKSINGLIKSFIEKNCNVSIDEGLNNLVRRLESQQPATSSCKVNPKKASVRKEYTRKKKNEDIPPVEKKTEPIVAERVIPTSSQVPINEKTITGRGVLFDIALLIGIVLLFLHIYLCYKLHYIDQTIHTASATCLNQCKKTCLANKFQP